MSGGTSASGGGRTVSRRAGITVSGRAFVAAGGLADGAVYGGNSRGGGDAGAPGTIGDVVVADVGGVVGVVGG